MKNSEEPINATLTYDLTSGKPNGHLLGLTKREYFAAMAMMGIVSNQEFLRNLNAQTDLVVEAILEISDKLLLAFEKKEI